MTCDELEQILLFSISGKACETAIFRAATLAPVEAHIRNCPACARKMTESAQLEDAFDALRLSTQQMEAPEMVEKNLLNAFHREAERRRSSVGTTWSWKLVWLSAAAVVLAVVGVLFLSKLQTSPVITTENHETESGVRVPHPVVGSGAIKKDANPDHGLSAESSVSASRSGVSRANKPVTGTVKGRPAGSLNDELSLNGGGSVVRVTLPLSSLTAMGLPARTDLSDPRVTADVWMDPFGDVMRVRLVAENRGPNQEER